MPNAKQRPYHLTRTTKYILLGLTLYLCHFISLGQQNKIDSLLSLLQNDKEDTSKINTLNALSRELTNTGDYEKAMQYANDALQLFQSSKTLEKLFRKGEANAYNNIGIIHDVKGDYDKALEFYFKSLKISEETGDKKGMAGSYNNIGGIHANKGDYDKALEFLFKALKINEEMGNKNWLANNYNNIGLIHRNKGDYDKALEFYFKGLKIFEELGNKNGMAASYNNIGGIHGKKGDYDKVLEFFFKSLKIKEEIGDKNGMANSYTNIGLIHADKGDYGKALEFYFKSLKIQEEIGDKNGMAYSYNNIGAIYYNKSDYDKALEFFFKVLKITEEIGDKNRMAASYSNIGMLYTKQKKYNEARVYLNKGLTLSKAIGAKDDTKASYSGLSHLDSILGNWKSAYGYHKLYSLYKDSIFNEESSKQIHEMSTKYETEKKEQQIKLLNKDKEIQTKDLERQKTIRNAVAGGLILVLLFSFVLINRLLLIRKQKKVIEAEREKSEKLLLNILPKETADELKLNNKVVPKSYEMVTVMFTDFKGFTTIAEKMSAEELVSELDFIFKKFDEIISHHPIEKIKTIGDAYMCAGGLPVANTTNPIDVVTAALEIQTFMQEQNKWKLRIGVHTGSVIAGVVGDKKFAYDIWGDAVNTASRMESSGEAGKVNISESTYQLVKNNFNCSYRGEVEAKNKGKIKMYFVDKK